jgi:hypothetical protein
MRYEAGKAVKRAKGCLCYALCTWPKAVYEMHYAPGQRLFVLCT